MQEVILDTSRIGSLKSRRVSKGSNTLRILGLFRKYIVTLSWGFGSTLSLNKKDKTLTAELGHIFYALKNRYNPILKRLYLFNELAGGMTSNDALWC
jgi:hypothetical protein